MRTTLELDDDVLESARDIARKDGSTLGKVISSLARKSLSEEVRPRVRNGVPLLPVRKNTVPVTMELVNRLRDEE